MNILIPHTWLLEHLDADVSPEELQSNVSLCGPSVEKIEEIEGDSVYDIEVTTNRVDSMSVRGIAREAATILDQFDIKAKLKPLSIKQPEKPSAEQTLPLPKIVNDPAYCKRVMAVILSDVKRAETPAWMAQRLRQIDISVHDAVIDITNYITHELGHPCHAFDYDKIMKLGGEIIVTEATQGEAFTTLDGEEYETVGGEIVFKNPAGEIIDLPAIKGTANSAIDDTTKNVLFWIESLDAKKVRFASMTHAIRTVAAQLNEKNVDPHLAETVMHRGIELYQELCDAQIASEIYDDFTGDTQLEPVTVQLKTIAAYLGLTIPTKRIVTILNELGCSVEEKQDSLVVQPPTFRPDIQIPADVIEEVARIYGYHNLPNTLMDTPIPTTKPSDTDYTVENKVKRYLAAIGWQEVYTYSMVSQAVADQSGYDLDQHLKLQNPLTDDREYLRRSLLPSLEEIIDMNPQREELTVYELALTYIPQKETIPTQDLYLGMVSNHSYQELKGGVEALLDQFFIAAEYSKVDKPAPGYAQEAAIIVDTTEIGSIGILKSGKPAAQVMFKSLLAVAKKYPTYQHIPKTNPSIEDLTFTVPEKTALGELRKAFLATDTSIVSAELKDIYQSNVTFTITYHDPEQTLTAEQLEPIRKKLVKKAATEFSAELVGKI